MSKAIATCYILNRNFWLICEFFNRNRAIYNELAIRGHNITVLSPDSDKHPPSGVHYILIENQYNTHRDAILKEALEAKNEEPSYLEVYSMQELSFDFCRGKIDYYTDHQ